MPRTGKIAMKPGLRALVRGVAAKGLHAVDGRSAAFKAVKVWRDEIAVALGGLDNLTPQRKTLLEMAAISRLILNHIDSFLLQQDSLIRRKTKSLYPIVEQRQRIADSLFKQLTVIGLDRVAAEASLPASWVERVKPYGAEESESESTTGSDSGKDGAAARDDERGGDEPKESAS